MVVNLPNIAASEVAPAAAGYEHFHNCFGVIGAFKEDLPRNFKPGIIPTNLFKRIRCLKCQRKLSRAARAGIFYKIGYTHRPMRALIDPFKNGKYLLVRLSSEEYQPLLHNQSLGLNLAKNDSWLESKLGVKSKPTKNPWIWGEVELVLQKENKYTKRLVLKRSSEPGLVKKSPQSDLAAEVAPPYPAPLDLQPYPENKVGNKDLEDDLDNDF